ncbi:MAG: M20 family metallopeptidase [Synergistes sp.]|nr:M20 family metallopeptidase [Synergistes sp.]
MEDMTELSSLGASLLFDAERIAEDMQDWRRDFHQFPEIAFEENITASKVAGVLCSIPGMSVTVGDCGMQTSVVGVLGADAPGSAIMLRATMDAIPGDEQTGLPFSSCMPGAMHASGHDAEMASLLGAAVVLSKYIGELKRKVVFVFQPAGEGRSGAKTLVENGIIEKYDIGRAIAVNWSSQLPYGELFTRRGVMTALSDRIHIDVRGTTGHASEPHKTVDPITIAANIIITIQSVLAREVDPREPVVLSFGQIDAGTSYNIIPEQANIWGTLRAFDPKTRDFVQNRIETVAPALAKALRGLASVEYTRNYSQVENNTEMVNELIRIGMPFFGEDGLSIMERPMLMGEDFSFFSRVVPSIFMVMGTGLEYPVNHPRYDTPESMLPFSAAWEAYLALTFDR